MSLSGAEQQTPDLGIAEIAAGLRDGSWSAREITAAALQRIAASEPSIRAWALVDAEGALQAAERADTELREGIDRGPLHGVPVGVKDIIDVAGWPTCCGSVARRDATPAPVDACVVGRLRESGALILGKTVTQEFAAGVVSAPARNPWDPARIPGGSSGGSAAAVALGNCFGALGSDTGGSIRIPAAACGVVGFKPTYGQLDLGGVYPLAWSLDTVGPLARGVADTWIMWQAMLGGFRQSAKPHEVWQRPADGVRVGVLHGDPFAALQPDVKARADVAVAALRGTGATMVDVEWPMAAAARAAAFIINRVETSAVHVPIAEQDPERFLLYGDELRLRIAAGRTIPATLYLEAKRVRGQVRRSMQALFAEHRLDALAAPTLPTTAVLADGLSIESTGLEESLSAAWTRLTMPFNATGQPVLSVPVGHDRLGLPVGMQFAGEPGREAELFRVGHALERELDLQARRPPLLAPDVAGSPAMESEGHGD